MGLSGHDVFLNVAGGVRLEEPAADLGVAAAIASSLHDLVMDATSVLIGEVGLGGEVRGVSKLELRLRESVKMGFTRAIVPKISLQGLVPVPGLEILGIESVSELLELLI